MNMVFCYENNMYMSIIYLLFAAKINMFRKNIKPLFLGRNLYNKIINRIYIYNNQIH